MSCAYDGWLEIVWC